MKDQYFGDVNDYRKYGLLRALQRGGTHTLLVAWLLTPDDGRTDGGLRSYLTKPKQWKHFDPDLYDGLVRLMKKATPRVSLLEGSGLLPCTTKFYSATIPDSRTERDFWRIGLIEAAAGVEVVFVDPDNGIEVPSKPVGRKGSSKYVTWPELEGIWRAGCSLLIYQHFRRERRQVFANCMVSELRARLQAPFIQAFRTAHVLFLLVAQKRHEEWFRTALSGSLQSWKGQIDIMPQADKPVQPAGLGRRPIGKPHNKHSAIRGDRMKTTDPGYLNRNGQRVVRATGLPGTDHRQRIYVLRCTHCGVEYGANGSDIHQRKCPNCQGGKPGLSY